MDFELVFVRVVIYVFAAASVGCCYYSGMCVEISYECDCTRRKEVWHISYRSCTTHSLHCYYLLLQFCVLQSHARLEKEGDEQTLPYLMFHTACTRTQHPDA